MVKLVAQSLPTPVIRGSNQDISKTLSPNCAIEKMKIKNKRPGMAHLLKKDLLKRSRFTVLKLFVRQYLGLRFWEICK